MTQKTTKVTLWTLLLVLTVTVTLGVFFEDGYDHHYTYTSESDILGLHNVTTIIKVFYKLIYYLRNKFCVWSTEGWLVCGARTRALTSPYEVHHSMSLSNTQNLLLISTPHIFFYIFRYKTALNVKLWSVISPKNVNKTIKGVVKRKDKFDKML